MNKSRKLSIYERNQLLKYSLKETDLLTKGDLPVEYLTGFVEFRNLELKINQNVLIPRVETEELLDLMIEFAKSSLEEISYLELGTGSGAISLAFLDFLLKEKSKALRVKQILISDLSTKALSVAQDNLIRLFPQSKDFSFKCDFLVSDLLKNVPKQKFNLVVANLPYIPTKLIASLEASVKDYEPTLALDGGEDGFTLIAQLLEQIILDDFLSLNGKIFLEVHETHTLDFIAKNYPKIMYNFLVEELPDQFDRHRFLILQKR